MTLKILLMSYLTMLKNPNIISLVLSILWAVTVTLIIWPTKIKKPPPLFQPKNPNIFLAQGLMRGIASKQI